MQTEIEHGDPQVSRGLNLYLYYWTFPVLLAFILINYFSKSVNLEQFDAKLMISVVSFLFGFLITITFSMIITRVSSVKSELATETGNLVSLYLLSKHLGKEFHERIREHIDDYTIKTLRDYTTYEISRDPYYAMYEDAKYMERKTETQKTAASSFFSVLATLEPVREKLEGLTAKRTEWSLKFAVYILGAILIALLFINRGDPFTNTLFIILSTTVIFIFLIIEDYDNLRIGDYTHNISNSEQLFDLLGKERYYPEDILPRTHLVQGHTYRIGIIDEITKKEKIFPIRYNTQFDSKVASLIRKFHRR